MDFWPRAKCEVGLCPGFSGSMGGVDRTGYQMIQDWIKAAAMLAAGKAFNAELVARLK